MKEQLISFETAKLAKEKGFDILCFNYYFEDGEFKENILTGQNGYYGDDYEVEFEEFLENWNDKARTKKNGDRCFGCSKNKGYLETFSAPTQSLLQKWLRENKEHIVTVHFNRIVRYKCEIQLDGGDSSCCTGLFGTYEEALEKGLQEALKLI